MARLSGFPEELVETVLSYSVLSSSSSPLQPISSSPHSIRSRLAILLVCRRFYRIATPLFYHSLHLHSPAQLQRLLALALRPNPGLALYVRRIVMGGTWAEAGELLARCGRWLRSLDVTLDANLNFAQSGGGLVAGQRDVADAEGFCRGLGELKVLREVVVRKPNNVYLTRPKLQYVLSEMTKAMHNWNDLESVDLAFRLSDDSGGTAALLTMLPISVPVPVHRPRSTKLPGPVTQLTQVLSSRPRLHTFSTHLPNVWNENILRVSQNPALERIILVDGAGETAKDGGAMMMGDGDGCGSGSGIVGTGHFFAQARRYVRLSELIRAGTSITARCRAQTMGNSSNAGYSFGHHQHVSPHRGPPSSSSSSYGGSSRLQQVDDDDRSTSARAPWQISHSWEYRYYHPSSTPGSIAGPSSSSSSDRNPPLSTSAP